MGLSVGRTGAVGLARVVAAVRAVSGVDVSSLRAWWNAAERHEPDAGPTANRRLTALTGAVILPLAALVLLTGLFFGSLWHVHFFLGFLLLPVALLKLSSTTYRMVRYYLRLGLYRQIRPPYPVARLTSPLLALSVVALFVSGIVMWLIHAQRDPWGWVHTDAAIVFSTIVVLHLGLYLPEAVRTAGDDLHAAPRSTPVLHRRRLAIVAGAVLVGLVLALATIAPSRFPIHAHHRHAVSTSATAGP
jgi:hypothetical protein